VNGVDPLGLCWSLPAGVQGPCEQAPPGINYNSSCFAGVGPSAPGTVQCGSYNATTCGVTSGSSESSTAASALAIGSLNAEQLSNFDRFITNLPKAAETPTVEGVGDQGAVEFLAKVPARDIPDSYAIYSKTVDAEGVTTQFKITTYAPDGSIVDVDVKFDAEAAAEGAAEGVAGEVENVAEDILNVVEESGLG
jgi:hypothetical protein